MTDKRHLYENDGYGHLDRTIETYNAIWNEKRWVFMDHADGVTYHAITKIKTNTGAMYIERRYTEITDPKWYHRPLYWLMERFDR